MMTINKSSRWKRLRALAVVPVIALALLAFANPKTVAAPNAPAVAEKPVSVAPSTVSQPAQHEVAPVTTEKTVQEQAPEPQTQGNKVFETVEQMPEFPGGEAAMIDFLSSNVNYPMNAAKNNVQGRVLVQFVVEKTGEIGEVKIARSVDEELDAEAIRVVKSMPNFIPGRHDGKAVAVWYTLPLTFKLQGDDDEAK